MTEASIYFENCEFIGIINNNQGFLSFLSNDKENDLLEICFYDCLIKGTLSEFSKNSSAIAKSYFNIIGDGLTIVIKSCIFSENIIGISSFNI